MHGCTPLAAADIRPSVPGTAPQSRARKWGADVNNTEGGGQEEEEEKEEEEDNAVDSDKENEETF